VGAAVTALVEREWLVDAPHSTLAGERELRFAYPLLWKLVYGGIEDGRRRSYHATIARWLELRSRDEHTSGPASPEAIGRQLELAGETRAASSRFRQAAEAARAAYQNEQAVRLFDRALACIGDADIAARVSLWHDLGSVYELVGDFEAALGAFERMLRLSWLAASKSKAAVAFNKMGRVWRRKGNLALALEYLERGYDLFVTADDSRGVAGSLDDIGRTLHMMGRYDDAFEKITDALARRGAGGDPRSIAASLSNLGAVQHDRGQFEAAATCHREALALRQQAGDRSGAVVSTNNLAVLAFEHGDLAVARTQWLAALADAEAIGALPMSAMILANLGELALRESKPEEARSRLEDALEIVDDIEDRNLEAECSRLLAELDRRAGKMDAARALAQRALETAREAGLREREALAHLTLAEIASDNLYDAAEDAGQTVVGVAEHHFQLATEILRAIGNDTELAKGLEAYARYLIEHGDSKRGKTLLHEALVVFTRLGLGARGQAVGQLLSAID
jgi:tetratricopeptide (TPR) repeat protein